jgi:hypothetical protein
LVEEAHYTVADGVVTLVNSAGVPILGRYGKAYEKKLPPLGDAHLIAGGLAKEAWHARGGGKRDFSGPIHYPKSARLLPSSIRVSQSSPSGLLRGLVQRTS